MGWGTEVKAVGEGDGGAVGHSAVNYDEGDQKKEYLNKVSEDGSREEMREGWGGGGGGGGTGA